jgi:hypothetical protein
MLMEEIKLNLRKIKNKIRVYKNKKRKKEKKTKKIMLLLAALFYSGCPLLLSVRNSHLKMVSFLKLDRGRIMLESLGANA